MADAGRIHQSLQAHNLSEDVIEQIMEGYQDIPAKCKKERKAAFISQVIDRMDGLLEEETRQEIIDWCACCKSGARALDKSVKTFGKEHKGQSLREQVEALNQLNIVGKPILLEDGTISTGVFWRDETENVYKCPCSSFSGLKLAEPVSITYCYCCAGHFRYHYQNAFGVELRTKEVVSSVLSSLGEKPCEFRYEVVEERQETVNV